MIALAALVPVTPARAQQAPPSVADTADRPGFADSPLLLRRGQIQFESGFAWEKEGRGADLEKTITWPQLELHGGVASRLEVSIAWDGLVSSSAAGSPSGPDERSTGVANVRLGAKFALASGSKFDAALIGYSFLPVGSDSVSSSYADPLLRFAWAAAINDRFSIAGTADIGAEREDDGRVRPKPAASAALGSTVIGALNGFVGVIAESPTAGSRPDVWSVEGGLMLPIGQLTQIDVWVSRRLSGSDDWAVGAGFVRRLRQARQPRHR